VITAVTVALIGLERGRICRRQRQRPSSSALAAFVDGPYCDQQPVETLVGGLTIRAIHLVASQRRRKLRF
jgi:hypothetical protein